MPDRPDPAALDAAVAELRGLLADSAVRSPAPWRSHDSDNNKVLDANDEWTADAACVMDERAIVALRNIAEPLLAERDAMRAENERLRRVEADAVPRLASLMREVALGRALLTAARALHDAVAALIDMPDDGFDLVLSTEVAESRWEDLRGAFDRYAALRKEASDG